MKQTWELLPVCPLCGEKVSYSQFTRNVKERFEYGLFDESIKYNIVCHNNYIWVELQIRKQKTIKYTPYELELIQKKQSENTPYEDELIKNHREKGIEHNE